MNKTLGKVVLSIIAVYVVLFVGYSLIKPNLKSLGSSQINYLTTASVSTSSVGTVWVKVSSATTRNWSVINNVGSLPVYIMFGTTTYAVGTSSSGTYSQTGILLTASSSMTFDQDHLFTGNVYAQTPSGTTTINVTDFK